MPIVWVTGNSGAGKSTVRQLLASFGELAVDSDWDGYSHWVDRVTDAPVADPPYPVPPGWLDHFAWKIDPTSIEELKASAGERTVYLCGSAENESDVRELFEHVVCLVVDDETLRTRLQSRTFNSFGKNPEELAAAIAENGDIEATYRRLGATIIDGTRPVDEIAAAILALGGPS